MLGQSPPLDVPFLNFGLSTMTLKIYANIKESFRIAIYNGDLIILSINENRYYLYPSMPRETIKSLNRGEISRDSAAELYDILEKLKALEFRRDRPRAIIDHTINGYFDNRWMFPETDIKNMKLLMRIKAVVAILFSGILLNLFGFRSLQIVKILHHLRAKLSRGYVENPEEIINRSIYELNKSFIVDFSQNKCLTYSLSLYILLVGKVKDLKLVVGVRTSPFCSHAWIEFRSCPVTENLDIRRTLSVILEV